MDISLLKRMKTTRRERACLTELMSPADQLLEVGERVSHSVGCLVCS